jgi:hypothetical protein
LKKINLILGIHNHQPVGNFDFVFEEAYQKAYKPFLAVLSQFPSIKIGMHYTGIIFDWIDRTYPECISDLRRLVTRGQVEMIGGGFYEPILPAIPDDDKIGQIKKLSQYVEEKTGFRPQGMWIAERVWEPHLAKPLHQAGMRYVILDDTHFQYAGLDEKELTGYYVTEEEGYKLDIFPISKKLRYSIPFQEPEKTIDYLKSLATEDGCAIAVFADDGEKFGIWPQTYRHVYQEKWLEKFFRLLVKNQDWITSLHFSEALTTMKPAGTVYIPTASYSEMQHWALPVKGFQAYENFEKILQRNELFDTYGVFVRGGFWRNFLVKYPEANRMHKKMLRISKRLKMLKAVIATEPDPETEEKLRILELAQGHLWASQCNCPYWHGVFGGIYLNNIRYAIYKEMLLSEKFLDAVEYAERPSWFHIEKIDYNSDGTDEILIETRHMNLYLDGERGAGLFELDYKDVPMNLTDSMTRREEGYHQKLSDLTKEEISEEGATGESIASIHDRILTKEKNLHEYLIYDRHPRQSFTDHFISQACSLEDMYRGDFEECGDFAGLPYRHENSEDRGPIQASFFREGKVNGSRILLRKSFTVIPDSSVIEAKYEITNLEKKNIDLIFGTELNLTLLAGNAEDRYYYFDGHTLDDKKLASKGTCDPVTGMGMIDEWQSIHINLGWHEKAAVWRYPVETVSLSEEGFERVYQNSCIFPHWRLLLKPNEPWRVTITLTLTRKISRP